MLLFIDLQNIEAIIKGRKESQDAFFEMVRMLKRGVDVQYNFSIADDSIKNNLYVQAWMREVKGDGVKNKSYYCPPRTIVPDIRPVKTNFYINYDVDKLCSIYFLDIDANTCNEIRKKKCIVIGCPGEELSIIDKFTSLDDNNIQTIKIRRWDEYCPDLPLTDIVMCDDYYFKHKNLYKTDGNEFLKALAKNAYGQLNVVLIIKEGEIDPDIDLGNECVAIRQLLANESGVPLKKCNVTILTSYRDHNRHAITNYYRIESSHGFFIHGDTKANDNTDIKPHIIKSAYITSMDFIDEYNNVASSPVKIYSSCGNNKKSNFLHFSQQ